MTREKLEALDKAAAKGWECGGGGCWISHDSNTHLGTLVGDSVKSADGKFAVASRNHFPALLRLWAAAEQVCGKEMEIDGVSFRQQEILFELRAALRDLESIDG